MVIEGFVSCYLAINTQRDIDIDDCLKDFAGLKTSQGRSHVSQKSQANHTELWVAKKKQKKPGPLLTAIVARRRDYALVVHVLWQLAVGRQLFSSPSLAEFSPLDLQEHDLPDRLQSRRNRYQYDASISAAVCHVDSLSPSTAPCPVALFDSVYFQSFMVRLLHFLFAVSTCLHHGSCFLVCYRRPWYPSVHSEDGRSWQSRGLASHNWSHRHPTSLPFLKRTRLAAVSSHRLILNADVQGQSLVRMIRPQSACCQLLLNTAFPWLLVQRSVTAPNADGFLAGCERPSSSFVFPMQEEYGHVGGGGGVTFPGRGVQIHVPAGIYWQKCLGWKCRKRRYFEPNNSNFSGGACPQTPERAQASPSCDRFTVLALPSKPPWVPPPPLATPLPAVPGHLADESQSC